jgi:uncharacterized protein (TIGR02588 family)
MSRGKAPRVRSKLAEWLVLGISLVLLLSVVVFLMRRALQRSDPFIRVETRFLMSEARKVGDQYILPVEVHNPGSRTISQLKIRVSAGDPDEAREIEIKYLAENSTTRLYLPFQSEPARMGVQAKPLYYRTD